MYASSRSDVYGTFRHMRAHELIADEQGGAGARSVWIRDFLEYALHWRAFRAHPAQQHTATGPVTGCWLAAHICKVVSLGVGRVLRERGGVLR